MARRIRGPRTNLEHERRQPASEHKGAGGADYETDSKDEGGLLEHKRAYLRGGRTEGHANANLLHALAHGVGPRAEPLTLSVPDEVKASLGVRVERCDVLERSRMIARRREVCPCQVMPSGRILRLLLVEANELARLLVGQRREQYRLDDAGHRGCSANPNPSVAISTAEKPRPRRAIAIVH